MEKRDDNSINAKLDTEVIQVGLILITECWEFQTALWQFHYLSVTDSTSLFNNGFDRILNIQATIRHRFKSFSLPEGHNLEV